ncbi:MAG: hypothetical protein V1918_10095, partial [Planctomycetota bacterium]
MGTRLDDRGLDPVPSPAHPSLSLTAGGLWAAGVAVFFLWRSGEAFSYLLFRLGQWPHALWIVLLMLAMPLGVFRAFPASRPGRRIAAVLVVFFLLGVWTVTGEDLARSSARWSAALLALFILASALSLGGWLLPFFLAGLRHPAERLVASMGLGLGALSLAMLLLGWAGGIRRSAVLVLLAAALLLGARRFYGHVADLCETFSLCRKKIDRVELVLLAAILTGVWMPLPAGFLPPLDYDVTSYHAELPREYLALGRVAFSPQNAWSGMPQNMEMLTTLSFALTGVESGWRAAKLVNWAFLPLLVLAAACVARRLGGRKAAWMAGVLALASPLSGILASMLYVELGLVVYGLLAVLAVLSAREGKGPWPRGALLLGGVFAGLACGTKYPGLLFAAAPLAAFAGLLFLGPPSPDDSEPAPMPWKRGPAAALWVGVGILIAFAPWLLRNAVETGNPVYPIWNQALSVPGWDGTLEARFEKAHRPSDFSASALAEHLGWFLGGGDILYPIALFFLGFLLQPPRRKGKGAALRERLGPARPVGLFFAWFLLIFALWFCLTHRLERFLFIGMVWAAVLSGLGWARLGGRLHHAALALVLASLSVVYFMVLWKVFLAGEMRGQAAAWGGRRKKPTSPRA